MDNISNITSVRNVANALTDNRDMIDHKTVSAYIGYLANAFAFYKIRRYDIHGKKYLATLDKYYLSDHSFRYSKLGTKNLDTGRVIENIVAMELLRRGYEVYVGVLYKKEIDFVAIKGNKKCFIQVAYLLQNEETIKREFGAYEKITDASPKYVLSLDKIDLGHDGIIHLNIVDFLMHKENLYVS